MRPYHEWTKAEWDAHFAEMRRKANLVAAEIRDLLVAHGCRIQFERGDYGLSDEYNIVHNEDRWDMPQCPVSIDGLVTQRPRR